MYDVPFLCAGILHTHGQWRKHDSLVVLALLLNNESEVFNKSGNHYLAIGTIPVELKQKTCSLTPTVMASSFSVCMQRSLHCTAGALANRGICRAVILRGLQHLGWIHGRSSFKYPFVTFQEPCVPRWALRLTWHNKGFRPGHITTIPSCTQPEKEVSSGNTGVYVNPIHAQSLSFSNEYPTAWQYNYIISY